MHSDFQMWYKVLVLRISNAVVIG